MTVSPHMQMAVTPVLTAKAVSVLSYDEPELTSQEDTEYSFEEKRLAVYLAAQVA